MVYVGKIFDIVIVNDKVAQLVLKKKYGDKIVPVAVTLFGYWKDKALIEMKLKVKDKIRGNLYLKSKIYNGKYYTDVFFKEVYLVEAAPLPMKSNGLFDSIQIDQDSGNIIDTDTGEVIEEISE